MQRLIETYLILYKIFGKVLIETVLVRVLRGREPIGYAEVGRFVDL